MKTKKPTKQEIKEFMEQQLDSFFAISAATILQLYFLLSGLKVKEDERIEAVKRLALKIKNGVFELENTGHFE